MVTPLHSVFRRMSFQVTQSFKYEVSEMEWIRIVVPGPTHPLSLQVDVIPGHTVILTERNITI